MSAKLNKPEFASVVIDEELTTPPSKDPLSNLYSPHFLRALEYIYGSEGIISSGGIESVDAMLKNIDLNNKSVLDLGSGFGGVDLYLAKKYKINITAVDCEQFMIERAHKLLQRSKGQLQGTISYKTLADPFSLKEFANNTFDIIICKQVLYHLPSVKRGLYLNEIFRVLKSGGIIVTEDLMVNKVPFTELVNKALNIDAVKDKLKLEQAFCYLITPEEYSSLMSDAGFQNVKCNENTDEQIRYTENDIERIRTSKEYFSKELGEDTYEFIVNVWNNFINAMRPHEIISGIFTAIKK